MTEVVGTDQSTGGQKGRKLELFSLIPTYCLRMLAQVYEYGSHKYSDRNWERGYPWSWSYDALQRHVNAFWGGEILDPESGLPHLAHAAWHCFTLLTFAVFNRGTDDRSTVDKWEGPQ